MKENIKKLLEIIYGTDVSRKISDRFQFILDSESAKIKNTESPLPKGLPVDETDIFVIAYSEQYQGNDNTLKNLRNFLDKYLKGSVTGIYILPFTRCSSDSIFSAVDFKNVNPEAGLWNDIRETASSYRLMADFVPNRCSVSSDWFKKFLEEEGKYRDYFITAEQETDLSSVSGLSESPSITEFDTPGGKKLVCTASGSYQADLNFGNPEVLMDILEVFFYHVKSGIQIIRLDADAFVWKEKGHLYLDRVKTNAVLKLFGEIVREYLPGLMLITEPEVHQREKIFCSGNRYNDEHIIYRTALPAVLLDAFLRENASHLREWAANSPDLTAESAAFFNFHAPCGRIKILPVKGILNEDEMKNMLTETGKRGGVTIFKRSDGCDIPCELIISYFSVLTGNEKNKEASVSEFLAFHSVFLALAGLPVFSIRSLLASGTDRGPDIEKFDYPALENELSDPDSLSSRVLAGYRRMLDVRKNQPSFSLSGRHIIPEASGPLFAILRISPDEKEKVLCMVNISGKIIKCFAYWDFLSSYKKSKLYDIITGKESGALVIYNDSGKSDRGSECSAMVTLDPWEVVWLK